MTADADWWLPSATAPDPTDPATVALTALARDLVEEITTAKAAELVRGIAALAGEQVAGYEHPMAHDAVEPAEPWWRVPGRRPGQDADRQPETGDQATAPPPEAEAPAAPGPYNPSWAWNHTLANPANRQHLLSANCHQAAPGTPAQQRRRQRRRWW